jgi:hypothetical protein
MKKRGEQEKKNIKDCIMPPFTTKLEKPCDNSKNHAHVVCS